MYISHKENIASVQVEIHFISHKYSDTMIKAILLANHYNIPWTD